MSSTHFYIITRCYIIEKPVVKLISPVTSSIQCGSEVDGVTRIVGVKQHCIPRATWESLSPSCSVQMPTWLEERVT